MNGASAKAMLFAGLTLLAGTAQRATADEWDQKTIFTFSNVVEIPGQVLPAGTYVFKLADSSSNVSASIDTFFSAVQSVANSPSDSASRQTMLSTARTLVARFNDLDNQLTTQASDTAKQIDDNVANLVIAQILFLAAEDPDKDISLYINSPGGVTTSGLAILDTMNLVEPDIVTYCVGQAASPLTVEAGTGRSSIGKRDSPVTRLKTKIWPIFVPTITTGTFWPSFSISANTGCAAMSKSQRS